MTAWTRDELSAIGAAEEIEIAPRRRDGTLGKPVTIWVARLGDDLYVRSVNGRDAVWFRRAQERHEGWIWADGAEKDVTLVDVDDDSALNGELDATYRAKYRRYAASIVNSIITPQAREATLRLTPRAASS